MTAQELVDRLGATVLNNKVRHPDTGVLIAHFVGDQLVLTHDGEVLAADMPPKTTRKPRAAAVESTPDTPAPEAEPSAPETAPE